MASLQLIYPYEISKRPDDFINERGENNMSNEIKSCECGNPMYGKPEVGYPWCPVPIPPPMPWPPVPYPPYPHPFPPEPQPEPDPGSVSQQICKLSRKANVITKMLENLETKKKDVIVSVGGISYNFGNIDLSIDGWTDGSYAATIKTMLEFELNLIKTKIAELAGDLGEDADLSAGIETTVGG